jgi:hypothetical protein
VIRLILSISILLYFSSCQRKISLADVDRNKFPEYFQITNDAYTLNGEQRKSINYDIKYVENDKVSAFIKNHPGRFQYLAFKTFVSTVNQYKTLDSSTLSKKYSEVVVSDSFFHNFLLLTNVEKDKDTASHVHFTVPEMMKVASRFFYCDILNEKDSTVNAHICVGLNGVHELKLDVAYTPLEAFCFEAVFTNYFRNQKLNRNFNQYIDNASAEEKINFKGFRAYLEAVKNKCFTSMENDAELKAMVINYYHQNKDNISFRIE